MKKHIRFIQENLVFSNLFVGFCALSLYKVSEILLMIPSNQKMSLFVFFSTLASYNFTRIPILFFQNEHFSCARKWVHNNKFIFILIIFLSTIVSIYYMILLGLIYLSLPLIFISLFYTSSPIRILKISFPNINLNFLSYCIRSIPFLKIFLISFSWTYLTIIIPAIINGLPFNFFLIVNIIIRFLFVFSITIPFDIRDLKFDKIITIPSFFGLQKAKIISYISLLFCEFLILILWLYNYLFFAFFVSLLIIFELVSLFIYFTKKDSKELFFSFYIEGLSLLMLVLVYIASYFI